MQVFIFLLTCLLIAGCGSAPKGGGGIQEVFLTYLDEPLRRSVSGAAGGSSRKGAEDRRLDSEEEDGWNFDIFIQKHPFCTEQDKINYLLKFVETSQNVFVRNGFRYSGNQAAAWLRWKMNHRQYRDEPILTAEGFVHRAAVRSNKTGEYYRVIMPDGRWDKLETLLEAERTLLEERLRRREIEKALPEEPLDYEKGVKEMPPSGVMIAPTVTPQ